MRATTSRAGTSQPTRPSPECALAWPARAPPSSGGPNRPRERPARTACGSSGAGRWAGRAAAPVRSNRSHPRASRPEGPSRWQFSGAQSPTRGCRTTPSAPRSSSALWGPGASGSSTMSAKLFVPAGAPLHSRGGARSLPSQVYSLGMSPFGGNAGELSESVMVASWVRPGPRAPSTGFSAPADQQLARPS
jgi:hypothetical protein